MTKDEMFDLRVTDQVRQGSRLGLVVCTKGMLEIHWDNDERPTRYRLRDGEGNPDLANVTIQRKAGPVLYSDPVCHKFRKR